MQNVRLLATIFALGTIFWGLFPGQGVATETVHYRTAQEACEEDHELPEVHVLPTEIGEANVDHCFHKGYETIAPHTETEKTCPMSVKPPDVAESGTVTDPTTGTEVNCNTLNPPDVCCTDSAVLVKRKYHCRFKGAGAVLGESGDIWSSGDEIYFQGEEPENYTTTDPDCEEMFNNMNTAENRYCYLE